MEFFFQLLAIMLSQVLLNKIVDGISSGTEKLLFTQIYVLGSIIVWYSYQRAMKILLLWQDDVIDRFLFNSVCCIFKYRFRSRYLAFFFHCPIFCDTGLDSTNSNSQIFQKIKSIWPLRASNQKRRKNCGSPLLKLSFIRIKNT